MMKEQTFHLTEDTLKSSMCLMSRHLYRCKNQRGCCNLFYFVKFCKFPILRCNEKWHQAISSFEINPLLKHNSSWKMTRASSVFSASFTFCMLVHHANPGTVIQSLRSNVTRAWELSCNFTQKRVYTHR